MGRFDTGWENSRVKSMLRQGLMHRNTRRRAPGDAEVIKVERFSDLEVWPCKVEVMALLICRSR
jgi:hypothetical protein